MSTLTVFYLLLTQDVVGTHSQVYENSLGFLLFSSASRLCDVFVCVFKRNFVSYSSSLKKYFLVTWSQTLYLLSFLKIS